MNTNSVLCRTPILQNINTLYWLFSCLECRICLLACMIFFTFRQNVHCLPSGEKMIENILLFLSYRRKTNQCIYLVLLIKTFFWHFFLPKLYFNVERIWQWRQFLIMGLLLNQSQGEVILCCAFLGKWLTTITLYFLFLKAIIIIRIIIIIEIL